MVDSRKRVKRLLRRARLVWSLSTVLTGSLLIAAVVAAFVLGVFVFDNLLVLPATARWVCLGLGVVLVAAAAWRWLLAALPVLASDERVAAYVEARAPDLDNALINSVQLGRGDLEGASNELAALYVSSVAGRLGRHTGWEAFDGGRLWRCVKRSAGPVAAVVACALLFPGAFNSSVNRLLNPATTVSHVAGLRIEVAPGDVTVPEGGDLEVLATVGDGAVEGVVLEYEDASVEAPVQLAMHETGDAYRAAMRDIDTPRTYRVVAVPARAPGAVSGLLRKVARRPAMSRTFRVDTVPPPVVEGLQLSYEFPAYTGRPPEVEADADGDIKAPMGTKVTLEGTSSKELKSAELELGDGSVPLEVDGAEFRGEFMVEADGVYRINLTDEDGFHNIEPIAHSIVAVPDRPPKIKIAAPDKDVTVSPKARVPLVFEVEDDHGLTEAAVCLRVGDDAEERVVQSFEVDGQTRLEEGMKLAMAEMGVKPGDILQAWVRAADNKPDAPQTARSRTVHVRIVGAKSEEEREQAAEDLVERLRTLLQDQKDLRDALDMPLKQAIGAGKALSMYEDDCRTGAERQAELREDAAAIAEDAVIEDWFVEQIAHAVGRRVVGEMTEAVEGLRALARRQEQGQDRVAGRVKKAQEIVIDILERLLALLEAGVEPGGEEPEVTLEELEDAGEEIDEEPIREKIEDALEEFIDEQRDVLDQTNNLSNKKREDLSGPEKDAFKALAAAEDDLSKFLEEIISDLSELPEQDFSEPSLRDEFVEVLAEVELAEDALTLENKLMAIAVEEMGLELAEELVHSLPSWLSDVPDKLKWDLEEPLEPYDVPMAELPEELTDLMGELIDEEAAMTDEVEDESSSWADSIDAGSGWATMDGPISNMSATGKTGNLLPNTSEIGGRSGEGRTGRAHGEFVEKTAQGKGGRDTPTRLSPDPFESGVVEDTSTDPMGGATGGGKLSGAGGDGLRGPVPPEVQQAMGRLAGMQADIRNKAERLQFKLDVVNIPVPGLQKSVTMMKELERDLRSFRYENVLEKRDVLLKTMRDSHQTMQQHIKVRGERRVYLPKDEQTEILEALDEEIVPEYREMVADYFRTLAESRR